MWIRDITYTAAAGGCGFNISFKQLVGENSLAAFTVKHTVLFFSNKHLKAVEHKLLTVKKNTIHPDVFKL